MASHSLMAMTAEFCREYEEAAESTRHTRSLNDLLKRNRGKTVEPEATYTDLKLNIGTYCGLLWTIFGDHCNYYKELQKIYRILDRKECFMIRNAYTREISTQITWAIGNEGRSFFGKNPLLGTVASLQDDEQQQGAGATNTLIWQNGPSSNNEVPNPLIDCGHGKSNNIVNNDPATGRFLDEVGGDVVSGQEGG